MACSALRAARADAYDNRHCRNYFLTHVGRRRARGSSFAHGLRRVRAALARRADLVRDRSTVGQLLVDPCLDLDTDLNAMSHDAHPELRAHATDWRGGAHLRFETRNTR